MSITPNNRFAQHQTDSSTDQTPYPVSVYCGPITNVGHPSPGGQPTMKHVDVADVAEGIRNGKWQKPVAQARGLAAYKDETGADGKRTRNAIAYDQAKKQLPFWIAAGHFVAGHRHAPDYRQSPTSAHGKNFPECVSAEGRYPPVSLSGLRFLEVDYLNDPIKRAAERARIAAHPSVVSCWVSAGGNGLHVTVLMDPKPASNSEAHVAFEYAAVALGLAATGDAAVKNMSRAAFVSHDPDAYLNLDATPLPWEMPEHSPQIGRTAHGRKRKAQNRRGSPKAEPPTPETGSSGKPFGPEDDACEDLVRRALDALIAGKAGVEDRHMLAVMGNLKALGLGFDEFDQWADAAGCTCDRRPRWENPPAGNQSDKPGWAIVSLAAAHYGFQYRKDGSNGEGSGEGAGKQAYLFAAPPPKPPPPSRDGLVPDYQAAWVAHAADGAAVVVRDLEQRRKDGDIDYALYAVEPNTGRLDAGELMTKHRVEAASRYLAAAIHLDDDEFGVCARHAREMRDAKNAPKIFANVGASRERYRDVWRHVPVYTPHDLDADLTVIGTPAGVWSVPDHRILTATEARDRLCTATIRWNYDADAAHPVAMELFQYLYGDLQDTTTREFARWRQAATALVRRPMQEIIVKISPSGSAKTTEGLLQENAFFPLVSQGERAALEEPSGYNTGGSAHNSYLRAFGRPARRINVSEVATENKRHQKPLNSRLLRDLSERPSITYRDPGPFLAQQLPYSAHLFIDGNLPKQGNDLLQIADPDSDNAKAVVRRLRGSPYTPIPDAQQRPELFDFGNPFKARNQEEAEDIAHFNRTIVRLMLDGMASHWVPLMEQLPHDSHSRALLDDLQNRGKAEWAVKWLPGVLKRASPVDSVATSRLVYADYVDWHQDNCDGNLAHKGVVGKAVIDHYGINPRNSSQRLDGRSVRVTYYDGWTMAV